MAESFGARLRQRREEQRIALITIAQQTKIKHSLLDALERDDVSQWPSGFYRRAFIRAYAQAIDLDPDVVLREFLEIHPEPPEVDVIEAMASALDRAPAANAGPATALRNAVGSAIGSLSRLRRGSPADNPAPIDDARNGSTPGPEVDLITRPAGAPVQAQATPEAVISDRQAGPPPSSEPDLMAVAHLCTELGRAGNAADVQLLLQQAAGILDAPGLIVWLWNSSAAELKPVLVHGYSDQVVSQLPPVRRDADNATAMAFRSAQMCAVSGSDDVSGAVVVPLLTPLGCTGVLAIELQRGSELTKSVCATATIVAAVLAQITHSVETVEVQPYTGTDTPRWGTVRL